jgi:hypothetical protein
MPAARGDRKPCLHLHCEGTMQFGREPVTPSPGSPEYGERGWVCSVNPVHFQRASDTGSSNAAERQHGV